MEKKTETRRQVDLSDEAPPMAEKAAKTRLTVDLSDEAYEMLGELQRVMEVSSKSDVFRLSLKAMHNVLHMEADGWQIRAHRGNKVAPVFFVGATRIKRGIAERASSPRPKTTGRLRGQRHVRSGAVGAGAR